MTYINGIEVPSPLKAPPDKGTEYWTLGGGRWTWYGTTHDFTSLGKGIWLTEQETWKVNRRLSHSLLVLPQQIKASFDYVHCTPHYSLQDKKLYISPKQYAAAKNKVLIINNAGMVKPYRESKFRERGYT